jgi:hypothetical protein
MRPSCALTSGPPLGRLALDQITGEHIAGLINDMRPKGYVGGTTNNVLVLLRYVFNLARKWNVPGVSVNPAHLRHTYAA